MRTLIISIVAIFALTVTELGHAAEEMEAQKQTFFSTVKSQAQERLDNLVGVIVSPIIDINVSSKDVDCLANNIFYESANEPEEGKVAVAMVTINRVRDGRFGKSICAVVEQRTVRVKTIEHTETKMVQAGFFGRPEKQTITTLVKQNVTVCQFSWKCMFVKKPKDTDARWVESQRVAQELLKGEYSMWQAKYSTALYFHNTTVRPSWAKSMRYVTRIGGHHFYSDPNI
jgi:spore germination cell wall hydrolase CwlJ-like protein